MVTWEYFKARRLKTPAKLAQFLSSNKCYDYAALCTALKEINVEPPAEGTVKLPLAPAPPRKRPPSIREQLGIKAKNTTRSRRPARKKVDSAKSTPKKAAEKNDKAKKS